MNRLQPATLNTVIGIVVLAAACGTTAFAETQLITNAQTVSALGETTATVSAEGITLTLTAGSDAELNPILKDTDNKDGSILGVGVGTDERRNANLEAGDTLTLTFDRDVYLRSLDFGFVGDDREDAATFTLGDGPTVSVFGNNNDPRVEPATDGITFENGDDIARFESGVFLIEAGTPVTLTNPTTTGQAYHLNAVSVDPVDGEPR